MDDQGARSGGAAAKPRGLRAAAQNLGWLMASRGVLALLSLIYLAIAARTLGVVDFGRFALIAGAAQALALFVGFQTWQIVVQYGVEHLASGDDGGFGRLLRACGLLDLFSALAGAALSIVILALFASELGVDAALEPYVLVFAVVQLLSLRSTPIGILRLRDKFSLAALADSMTPLVRLIGALAALLVSPTIEGFLVAWAAAEIVTATVYWVLAWRTGDLKRLWAVRADRRVLAENPGLVRFALSTNATATLGLSSKQVPLLLVGAYVGPAAAGAFRLAFQIAQALAKFSQLLARAGFPEIVRAVRTAGVDRLRGVLGKLVLVSAGVALVILGLVALVGKPLLLLIGGSEYVSAYPILLWLAAAGCVELATVGFEPILMAVHRAGTAFALRAVATLLLLAAMVVLTPIHGATGAAIAVLVGSLATAILLGVATIRVVGSGKRPLP